jgi:hypothetical protein
MSQEQLEARVGKVEDSITSLTSDVRVVAHDQAALRGEVSKIGAGVDELLKRDARRPQAMTWQTIGGTCGGLVAIAAVVWWLIGAAPVVQDLDKRLSRLDDPEVGRIPRVEKKVQELDQWRPSVTKY